MKKLLPLFVSSVILLSACGGGSLSLDNNGQKPDDDDKDTIINTVDNCPSIANTDQLDSNNNGIGDACESSQAERNQALQKISNYAKSQGSSNTPTVSDYTKAGVIGITNENLSKVNQKVVQLTEADVDTATKIQELIKILNISTPNDDFDGDGVKNSIDNCPIHVNPNQKDTDFDHSGNVCDLDDDADSILDRIDNCPLTPNTEQSDLDNDGIGDVCDTVLNNDNDNDGIANNLDNCPNISNINQNDLDNDGIGDACDTIDNGDNDSDGIINSLDNCLNIANSNQLDADNNGIGDVCEITVDSDRDGSPDSLDEFPNDPTKISSITSAHRLLTQATFGATEAEIDYIVKIGTEAWIKEQFAKPSAYDSSYDNHKTHFERTVEIAQAVQPSETWYINGVFNYGIASEHVAKYQMSDWWENALGHPTNIRHGSDQLRQKMAYALSQIIVVSAKNAILKKRSESIAVFNDILAKNAFGNYREILGEISRSPAMGAYLSHMANDKANPLKSTRPDENFARELIQLFTIGLYELNIDGSFNRDNNSETYPDAGTNIVPSYTQDDVEEIAKVMTGWDSNNDKFFGYSHTSKSDYTSPMQFYPEHHEDEAAEGGDGYVTILGATIKLDSGTDHSGMDAVLDLLMANPNIAPSVSKRLIMLLVTSNPSPEYVARVSRKFNNNGKGVKGDLKAVLEAILSDDEARNLALSNTANYGKIKEPLLAWTQFLRAFNVKPLNGVKGVKTNGVESTVNGIYFFSNPEIYLGQGPFRSPSVFNFYQPDYVPSDEFFSSTRMVAPEAQIQTDQTLVSINNILDKFIYFTGEKNTIPWVYKKTIEAFSSSRKFNYQYVMLINFDKELEVFEQALDGDTNGDFLNMGDTTLRNKAIDALLDRLNKIMLGNTMTAEYRATIKNYLSNADALKYRLDNIEALKIIQDSVRFMLTSSAYMVQK
jgi:uncharacterized protein (DUF1800 family)